MCPRRYLAVVLCNTHLGMQICMQPYLMAHIPKLQGGKPAINGAIRPITIKYKRNVYLHESLGIVTGPLLKRPTVRESS
jgi:hypothetical protein